MNKDESALTSTSTDELLGTWLWNKDLTLSSDSSAYTAFTFEGEFYCGGVKYTKIRNPITVSGTYILYTFKYYENDSESVDVYKCKMLDDGTMAESVWTDEKYRTINITSITDIRNDGKFLIANATKVTAPVPKQFFDATALNAFAQKIATYIDAHTTYRITDAAANGDNFDFAVQTAPRYLGATINARAIAPSTFAFEPIADKEPVTKFKDQIYTHINDPDAEAGASIITYSPTLKNELVAHNLPTDVNEYITTEPICIDVNGYDTGYGNMRIEFSNYVGTQVDSKLVVCFVLFTGEQNEDGSYAEEWKYSFDGTINSAGNIVFGVDGGTLEYMGLGTEANAMIILALK